MLAALLLSLRHLGCDHGVPADPTATRLSRRRPGYPDGDPASRTATRLARRHLDQHNGILAVRQISHGDRVPDTMTDSWLCSGHAGSVPACEQCLNHAGNVAECRQCPQEPYSIITFLMSRPCRQCPSVRLCPRHTGRVPAVPTVSWCVSSKCVTLSFVFGRSSSPDPRSLRCFINPGHGHHL